MTSTDHSTHIESCGNVFTDLGLPDSDALLAKAALASQIFEIAGNRGLTQSETARVIGTTQPKVSDLFAGRLTGFSLERLIRYLNALDRDVRIVVGPKAASCARGTLEVSGDEAKGQVLGHLAK
ncbi:MAG: helix-turn-helix domain-containing protein [Coriobacteriia bacterium]